ncbi:hypothetical protein ACT17_15205 [Mycolicibacterium conceptionense]|uniref:Helix-turn-helix domain-containing protein n=1 Tax=Mycolicibacterium conceptionense TaxID=451644 RepID=A0A0J8U9E0_9MYCO|nr:excisionase family DNA-binding protein [Mycolicibacterium conceptionense]KMV17627.1 hypothetical protein ACT17_15205 [Mycolicibacterium conceptionense]
MTALNPAIGAKPGEAFIARDGSTWVWRPAGAPAADRLWLRVGLRGRTSRRTQNDAESAGLMKLVCETEKLVEALHTAAWVESVAEGRLAGVSLGGRVRVVRHSTATARDRNNPERLRTPEALRFAAAVLEALDNEPHTAYVGVWRADELREKADRMERERAEEDQVDADGNSVERYSKDTGLTREMNPDNADDERIGVPEAAAEMAVHPDTIRSLIHRGALPALRVGQRFRIRRGDLYKVFEA